MKWLKQILGLSQSDPGGPGSASARRITPGNPLVIESPRLGFLNLLGSAARAILEEDKAEIGRLFASLVESTSTPPVCDVLMIYANLESDGVVAGSSDGLRDIIRKSAAPIVVIASENSSHSYIAAGRKTGYGQANLVMTLARNGCAFPTFFTQLFRRMFDGESMPIAWVELVPQHPGAASHDNLPGTIFAAEVSHIVFKST